MIRRTHYRAIALAWASVIALVAPRARAQSMPGMMHEQTGDSLGNRSAAAAATTVYHDHGDLVFDVGPTDLPANAMHDMVRQPPVAERAIGADGWVHGYRVEIVDSAGDVVPQTVLHHLEIAELQKRELFSPLMLRIAAAGAETAPINVPRFAGFRVSASDSVLVSVMLHNPTDRAYHGVHVRVRMPFSSSASWVPTLSLYPLFLDVMPPVGSHSFDILPGRTEHYWEGKPAVSGRILGVSGQLHKYGVLLQLEDRTEHRVLWSVKPDTDATGAITAIPISNFLWKFGIPIRPDHVYRLTAVYDNPTGHTIIDGGMGALGGAIHLTGDAPAVDRADPGYQFDVRYTWREIRAPNDGPPHMPQP